MSNTVLNKILCPVCLSKNYILIIEVNNFNILRCKNCDLCFTQTSTKKININSTIYDQNYIESYQIRSRELVSRFINHLRIIDKYSSGGRLLDVGCSTGLFLKVVIKNSKKWKVFGLEINKNLASYVKHNVTAKIYNRRIPDTKLQSKYFNCITCFDVLEHSYDLKKNIKEFYRLLLDDGLLYIQSPNYDSFYANMAHSMWDWWSPPDHALHFSLRYLSKFLTENGFEIIEQFSYQPLPIYLCNMKSVIKTKYKNRYMFYLLVPILVLIHYLSIWMNKGALLVILCRKKK